MITLLTFALFRLALAQDSTYPEPAPTFAFGTGVAHTLPPQGGR